MERYVLYAMPGSLYSAKARSYLRKQRIDYVERVPGDPRFERDVIPQTGRWIIPVLERPDGTLISADARGSIHQVGAEVQKAPSCNGWTFWYYEQAGQLMPIDLLRQQIRAENPN